MKSVSAEGTIYPSLGHTYREVLNKEEGVWHTSVSGGTLFPDLKPELALPVKTTWNVRYYSENEKVYQRSQVNKQLQALLDQYHIAIPADAALTFTITPIDYQVKVSGTDDEQLIHQIEQILQSGENSKQLFLHIMKSLSSDSAQYSKEAHQKYQTVREIYEVTGYHLKDLEVVDGRYVTPSGRDLLEVYKEELEKDPVLKKCLLLTEKRAFACFSKAIMMRFCSTSCFREKTVWRY